MPIAFTQAQKLRNDRWLAGNLMALFFIMFVFHNVVMWFLLPIWIAVTCYKAGISCAALGLTRKKLMKQSLMGVGMAAAISVVFVGIPVLFVPIEQLLSAAAASPAELIQNLLYLFWVVGPIEEFLFRGYFQEAMARATHTQMGGVLLSSLLFGCAHFTGSHSLMKVCCTALIGGVLSLCKWKIRDCTLLTTALAHSVYNVILELLRWFLC